ncbi:MAG TPA: MFS transporter, partial [Acidimicrobiales bacterium]|nr:MFS transporter [Acidimicrobiales bacterium]
MSTPSSEVAESRMDVAQRLRNFVKETGSVGVWPLLVLMALAGVQNVDVVAFGVLSPDIRDTFGLSNAGIDAIASLTAAVPVAFSVFLGYIGDRTNRVRLTSYAAIVFGAMAVLTGLAPALAILVIARIVGGTGFLSSETITPGLLSDYYPPKILGSVFGTYRFGSYGLSLAVGAGLAGIVGSAIGWRATYVLLALPTFALVVFVRVLLKEPERGATQGLAVASESESTIGESFRRVRAIRTLRRTWTSAFLFGAGTLPFATLLSTFFKDVYHQGDAARGVIATVYGLGGLLGIGLGGWLGQRAVSTGQPRKLALINGLMIVEFAGGIILMAGLPVLALSVVAVALLSIGAFGFLPAYTTLVSVVAPPRVRAQAFGWSLLFYSAGAVVITPIVGSIGDAHGQRAALLFLAVLVAAGGMVGASCARFVDR